MSHKYYQGEEWWINDIWEPTLWAKRNKIIVGDGCHTITGQRLHIISDMYFKEEVPSVIDNALVVTEEYFNEHFKEKGNGH